jgi:hypothetical protein
LTSN